MIGSYQWTMNSFIEDLGCLQCRSDKSKFKTWWSVSHIYRGHTKKVLCQDMSFLMAGAVRNCWNVYDDGKTLQDWLLGSLLKTSIGKIEWNEQQNTWRPIFFFFFFQLSFSSLNVVNQWTRWIAQKQGGYW